MGIGGIWQWVVILLILALLFGTKRLRGMGSDLGQAIKGFRSGMREAKEDSPRVEADDQPAPGATANDKAKTTG